MHREVVDSAARYWAEGQLLEAGRLIFGEVPEDSRPYWGARILRLVIQKSGVDTSPFRQLLDTVDRKALWGNGHRAFSQLRNQTLALDRKQRTGLTKAEQLLGGALALAELVAKITYNATHPPDPFDEDSGWWIVPVFKQCVECLGEQGFTDGAWNVIVGHEE